MLGILAAVLLSLCAQSSAQSPLRPLPLTPRTRIDTVLAQGARHVYALQLGTGASAEVTVLQRGVDLVVEVRNERDSLLFTMDSPNGRNGPEVVELIAPRAANYRLVVRAFDEREPQGPYTLSVSAWRSAAATRQMVRARQQARDAAAAWLRSRSVPLPGGSLAPLDALADRAAVIGIGEATHGSREFGDLRLALTRYLVERHGFRLVAIEMSAARLAVLDRYSRGLGSADSVAPVLETGWIGRRALRELVAWLREWNRQHPGDVVRLVGLDAQENALARRDLRAFVARAYPRSADRYAAVERELAAADSQAWVFGDSRVDSSARRFLRELVAQAETDAPALRRLTDTAVVRAGLEAARVLRQFAEFNSGEQDPWSQWRDWYMALNLLAALDRVPQGKGVVWAHNSHVAAPPDRGPPGQRMGTVLRNALGCRYAALAVTFGQGAFVAQLPNDLEDDLVAGTLPPAPESSIEGLMGSIGGGRSGTLATWSCDARAGALPAWLAEPQRMHLVGALFRPGSDPAEAFRPVRLVDEFDGIVFIPVVTADEMPTDRPLIPARRR